MELTTFLWFRLQRSHGAAPRPESDAPEWGPALTRADQHGGNVSHAVPVPFARCRDRARAGGESGRVRPDSPARCRVGYTDTTSTTRHDHDHDLARRTTP
ncbi:hypothetical protein ARHIZOSPH14_19750 [Agromyces rhizosphaerae]|uniref:Uncharacterized protein n=1 Tax=Agromyces rhizosphaerae TaxID=88374 RepID=A0A9W6CSL0_9MICO|nr:hypothetical protein ARHIZOSPH14_19750 [Agromyces rhizosphaerae]